MRIFNADCLEFLRKIDPITSPIKTIFMDPPDNLGLKYNEYKDDKRIEDYYEWLRAVILESLARCKIFWLSYYPGHDLEIMHIIRDVIKYRHPSFDPNKNKDANINKFLWYYTFSQYNDYDCAYGYRPIIRLMRGKPQDLIGENINNIREESVRMTIGDARAAGLRVPDNVWKFSRVVGNAKERMTWHPTQHPIHLMNRILKMSMGFKKPASQEINNPQWFIDLFGGTGTTLRAISEHNRIIGKDELMFDSDRVGIVEIDEDYCERIKEELEKYLPEGISWGGMSLKIDRGVEKLDQELLVLN